MKLIIIALITLWLLAATSMVRAQTSKLTDAQLNYLKSIKEQVALPDQAITFIDAKKKQAGDIAQKNGFELSADYANFFSAARTGRAREAEQFYLGPLKDTNNPAYITPLTEVTKDVVLVLEAFAEGDRNLVLLLANDTMNSLPPGCIYLGGSDSGRGLPTLMCKSPGDPIFVLSQNTFLDGRYMEYVRDMYGSRIQLPSTNEVKTILNEKTDAKGFAAFAAKSGLILKSILDKNPEREFYYEQGFVLDSLYPYMTPHNLLIKISHQPVASISANEIKKDADFWSAKLAELKSNPQFATDDYARRGYLHKRVAIAELYAWRTQTAKDAGEHQRMFDASSHAFDDALAINASSTEVIYPYVNLLLSFGKPDMAMTVVKSAIQADPSNEQQWNGLIQQIEQMMAKAASAKPDTQPH